MATAVVGWFECFTNITLFLVLFLIQLIHSCVFVFVKINLALWRMKKDNVQSIGKVLF